MIDAQNPPIEQPEGDSQGSIDLGRRGFLLAGFWTSAAVAGLTLTGVGGRFVVGESLASPPAQWVNVGEVTALSAGQMQRATYAVRRRDAWRTTEQKGLVYISSEDGVTFDVLSGTCTHLGCNVHWREESESFRCPCHDGYFSRDGSVLSGPPQRPLVRLQTKIEDGVLYALI